MMNMYKPYRIGMFDMRKHCSPKCREAINYLGIDYARIMNDRMYVVSPGTPIDYWALDLSDKNQTISVQLSPKYDEYFTIGNDFAMSQDGRYIYTMYRQWTQGKPFQGISVLDTETKQQNDFVFGEGYGGFSNLVMSQDEERLYGLFNGELYVFDIQEKMHINLLKQTKKSNIESFVFSKKYNKIYAFSNTAVATYAIETDGTLKQEEKVILPSAMLRDWGKTISLSPNEEKVAINTRYGLRVYFANDAGSISKERFADVDYPEGSVGISRVVWIDNSTFVAGGYIVRMEK